MKIVSDTHSHTVASGHAYSTVMENALAAREKELSLLCITDHAPNMPGSCHSIYFSNFNAVPRFIQGVEIWMGVELNLLDFQGRVDLPDNLLQTMDLVIASLHPPCITPGSRAENTQAILCAIENPLIHIIGHPGDPRYPIDAEAVVSGAVRNHTLLEINNHSLNPLGYRAGGTETLKEMILACRKRDWPIILGSDAHFADNVGNVAMALQLVEECGMPEDLVLNTSTERLRAWTRPATAPDA